MSDICGNMRMTMMSPGDGEEFGAGDLGPRPDRQDPGFPRWRQVCIFIDKFFGFVKVISVDL